jgi:hypothetical protein
MAAISYSVGFYARVVAVRLKPDVVQFCSSVLRIAASVFHRLDGRKQIGATTRCLLCGRVFSREHDLHVKDAAQTRRERPQRRESNQTHVFRHSSSYRGGPA